MLEEGDEEGVGESRESGLRSSCEEDAAADRYHERPNDEAAIMEVDDPQQQRRAKAYRLDDTGVWQDLGTGHVSVGDELDGDGDGNARGSDNGILLVKGDAGELLLRHEITKEDVYKRQSDTIISWSEDSVNLALSFQEAVGCTFLWENICSVQRQLQALESIAGLDGDRTGMRPGANTAIERLRGPDVGEEVVSRGGGRGLRGFSGGDGGEGESEVCSSSRAMGMGLGPWSEADDAAHAALDAAFRIARSLGRGEDIESGREGGMRVFRGDDGDGGHDLRGDGQMSAALSDVRGGGGSSSCLIVGQPDVELPMPDIGVDSLEALARTVGDVSPFGRERVAGLVQREGWLKRLFEVFHICEDMEDEASLASIFRIVRGLVLLNDGTLLDVLLDSEYAMDLMGVLEYDPELSERPQHRQFLVESATFKEVVPIDDPAVKAKIHQTFRIGYVKDVVLARALDDGTFATLNSLMLFNNVEVVSALQRDPAFMEQLFSRLSQAAVAAAAVLAPGHDDFAAGALSERPPSPPAAAQEQEERQAPSSGAKVADATSDAAVVGEFLSEGVVDGGEIARSLDPAIGAEGASRSLESDAAAEVGFIGPQVALLVEQTRLEAPNGEAVNELAPLSAKDVLREWRDLVLFLQELAGLSRHLQPAQRGQLLSSMVQHGLFEILTHAAASPDDAIQLAATEVMVSTMTHDPQMLRSFLLNQPGNVLYGLLIRLFIEDGEGGLQAQLLEMIRALLDPETMDQTGGDKGAFLDKFYDLFLDQLVTAVYTGRSPYAPDGTVVTSTAAANALSDSLNKKPDAPVEGGDSLNTESTAHKLTTPPADDGPRLLTPASLGYILELLCFCVQQHGFRIKYYLLRHNVIDKVLRPTARRPERFLVVAGVRFFRTCIGLKDEFYHRHITRQNLFALIVEILFANGDRYNLLNSALLELFEFIRKNNLRGLICHIWEGWGEQLSTITYTDVFQNLQIKYEQIKDGFDKMQSANGPAASTEGNQEYVEAPPTPGAVSSGVPGKGHQELSSAPPSRLQMYRRRREGSMDQEEEDYFNQDDADSDPADEMQMIGPEPLSPSRPPLLMGNSSPPGPSGAGSTFPFRHGLGLVDYDDDEEETFGTATSPSRATSPPLRGEGRVTSSGRSLSPGRLGLHTIGGHSGRGGRGRGISISISPNALSAVGAKSPEETPLAGGETVDLVSEGGGGISNDAHDEASPVAGGDSFQLEGGEGAQLNEQTREGSADAQTMTNGPATEVIESSIEPTVSVVNIQVEAKSATAMGVDACITSGAGVRDIEVASAVAVAVAGDVRPSIGAAVESAVNETTGVSTGAQVRTDGGATQGEEESSVVEGRAIDSSDGVAVGEVFSKGAARHDEATTPGEGDRATGNDEMTAGQPSAEKKAGSADGCDSNGTVFVEDVVESARLQEGEDGTMSEPFAKRRRRDDVNALMVNT